MDKVNGKLTVFFEEPFWVGIFERIEDSKLSAAKVTFGAEPKDCEVQEYIQKWYFSLKFSPVVENVVKDIKRNPKRMQREAKETDAGNRHWYKIATGVEITAGTEQQESRNAKRKDARKKRQKSSACLN